MTKYLSLESRHPDLDLKVRTPDCEAGVLVTGSTANLMSGTCKSLWLQRDNP